MADYAVIREVADDNHTIYLPWAWNDWQRLGNGGARYASWYFLAGKNLVYTDGDGVHQPQQAGDYLLLLAREDNPALLTPDNRHIFLYDWALYEEWLHSTPRPEQSDNQQRIPAAAK